MIHRIGLIFAPLNRSASYLLIYGVYLVYRRREIGRLEIRWFWQRWRCVLTPIVPIFSALCRSASDLLIEGGSHLNKCCKMQIWSIVDGGT